MLDQLGVLPGWDIDGVHGLEATVVVDVLHYGSADVTFTQARMVGGVHAGKGDLAVIRMLQLEELCWRQEVNARFHGLLSMPSWLGSWPAV